MIRRPLNKISFLKSFDKVIGKSLVALLSRTTKYQGNSSESFKSVLFIRPGGIGDAVLLLPALSLLRKTFPDAHIDILCEKRNADIFGLSRDVHRAYLYDKGLDLFRCLSNTYDVVIDTEQWHRLSAIVAYFTKAPIRTGFATNERGQLLTHQIPYRHDDYEVYSFFHLLEPLIGNAVEFNVNEPFLDVADDIPSAILPWFKEGKDRIVAIFPGASVRERRWGGNRFGDVAKGLSEIGYRLVLLGSSADKTDADLIKKKAPDAIDLTGKTDLKEVTAVLGMSKLLISADSGLLHIAYALGTPTVSLFGSGIEEKWAPRGKKHIVINKHLDCSPCTRFGYTPTCGRNIECLVSIHVGEVIEAARTLLDAS